MAVIAREELADLQPGDVVEITNPMWPIRSVVRGAVVEEPSKTVVYGSGFPDTGKQLLVCGSVLRWSNGAPAMRGDLTVISRAPRPLYVNHDRAEPVPGDIARDAERDTEPVVVYGRHENERFAWRHATDGYKCLQPPDRLRLLVDGETGQVVP